VLTNDENGASAYRLNRFKKLHVTGFKHLIIIVVI